MHPHTAPVGSPAADRTSRLERTLWRVRWFGVALGVYQIAWYEPNPGTTVPGEVVPVGLATMGALVAANLAVSVVQRRGPSERATQALGAAVFAVDIAAMWTLTFVFTFERFGATWVVLTILTLEGALRYAYRGAIAPVALAVPLESLREWYGAAVFGHPTYISSVTFRVGMIAIIGLVAGAMARNLERERQAVEDRAVALAHLAEREREARLQIDAFQHVILAGMSEQTIHGALRRMLPEIATGLGYGKIAILLLGDRALTPVALHGFPASAAGHVLDVGAGIAGAVIASGRSEVIDDVTTDPRYMCVDPATCSQVTVPIWSGDIAIGVIDVESDEPAAFDADDVTKLERLGRQMALVIENARHHALEQETIERLQILDAMKSDFVAIASHELRTPLTAMNGVIKTLRRPDVAIPDDEIAHFLEILDRQTDRLTKLIEDLLTVSRIEGGDDAIGAQPADIGHMLREIVAEAGASPQRVTIQTPDAGTVWLDERRIRQIVRNLVENALKFSPSDTVVLVCAGVSDGALDIEVTDHGVGIPAAEIDQIFERFHQVGGSLRRHADGFGLGLYITKRLVDSLGGTVTVDSTPGSGTTFRVRIPVVEPASEGIA